MEHIWCEITELPDEWKYWIHIAIPGGEAIVFHCANCNTYVDVPPTHDFYAAIERYGILSDCHEQMIFKILES